MKGLRSTNRKLQNSHTDVKYGTGNIVNKFVITIHGIGGIRLVGGITLQVM